MSFFEEENRRIYTTSGKMLDNYILNTNFKTTFVVAVVIFHCFGKHSNLLLGNWLKTFCRSNEQPKWVSFFFGGNWFSFWNSLFSITSDISLGINATLPYFTLTLAFKIELYAWNRLFFVIIKSERKKRTHRIASAWAIFKWYASE